MKNKLFIALLAGTLSSAAMLTTSEARADDGQFSLTGGFDISPGTTNAADKLSIPTTGQYETGPWVFKLIVPNTNISSTSGIAPRIGHAGSTINNTTSSLNDTVAAATYNLYAGGASSFGVDLTGKVKLGVADKFYGAGSGQNDYAAQADAHQSLDKFKALGSLGYKIQGDSAGIGTNRILYGSVGGAYQLNEQVSGGVDFSLTQNPTTIEQGQRQLSAYVDHNINKSFRARGYVLKGFSNGSPDRSLGAAVSYGF